VGGHLWYCGRSGSESAARTGIGIQKNTSSANQVGERIAPLKSETELPIKRPKNRKTPASIAAA